MGAAKTLFMLMLSFNDEIPSTNDVNFSWSDLMYFTSKKVQNFCSFDFNQVFFKLLNFHITLFFYIISSYIHNCDEYNRDKKCIQYFHNCLVRMMFLKVTVLQRCQRTKFRTHARTSRCTNDFQCENNQM